MADGSGLAYDIYMRIVEELNTVADHIISEIIHRDCEFQVEARNLAKVLVNLQGILRLSSTGNYLKGWVLAKSLWVGFEHLRLMDPEFLHEASDENVIEGKTSTDEEVVFYSANTQYANERYDSFKREKLMDGISRSRYYGKELNLKFIYDNGYSPKSSIESPYMKMRKKDLMDSVSSLDENTYEDEISLLSESSRLTCLIMNETMNMSSLEWKWIIFDYLKSVYDFLEGNIERLPLDFGIVLKQCEESASKVGVEGH